MASQQPPARSWFRLASVARMEAAEAAAAAATAGATANVPRPTTPLVPRIPIPRPQQQPTSPPLPPPRPPPPTPPPPPPPQAEPQPELPVIQTLQPEIQTQTVTAAAAPPPSPPPPFEPQQPSPPPRAATPPESPKVIRPSYSTPPPSPTAEQPKTTPIKPPPSPVPEPEPETKPPPPPQPQTFSVAPEEKTITNSNGSRPNNVSYNKQHGPATLTKEEKKLRVITMAGENTGAVMDFGSTAQRHHGHHVHHASTKVQEDGNGHGRMVEQENADSEKGGKTAAKTKHMEAVVNSNVQGINNSIVLNSSCTQHSPGVHITFASSRQPKGSTASSSSHKAHRSHLH